MENNGRDQFVSKIGFILACVGSAVGMANIWLFPYRLGQLGGAAFLIPYLLFVFLIGYTGVVEEMAFGRAMKIGPLGAFHKATLQKGSKPEVHDRVGDPRLPELVLVAHRPHGPINGVAPPGVPVALVDLEIETLLVPRPL